MIGRTLIFFLFSFFLSGQNISQNEIDKLIEEYNLNHALLGISIVNIQNSNEIINYNSEKNLTPASTHKIVSTVLAWETLGEKFQFFTQIAHTGKIQSDGVLDGDLIILASGDPGLASEYFSNSKNPLEDIFLDLSNALKKTGINCIDGKIIAYMHPFGTQAAKDFWPYQDLGNYYASGSFGLNVIDNRFHLHLQQKTKESSAPQIIGTTPQLDIKWENELKSGPKGSGDQAYIYGNNYDNNRFIRGSIPIGSGRFTIKGSLPNPPYYFLNQLSIFLINNGIKNTGELEFNYSSKNIEATKVYEISSPGLKRYTKHILHKSDNLYAEALYNKLLADDKNALNTLIDKYNLSESQIIVRDGSGLSPSNAISAHNLTSLLKEIKAINDFNTYTVLLPSSAESASVRRYTTGIPNQAIRAKTGSMSEVRAIAGYLESANGDEIAFTLIINNYSTSKANVYKLFNAILRKVYELN